MSIDSRRERKSVSVSPKRKKEKESSAHHLVLLGLVRLLEVA
jgi:hypothetical protein